MENSHLSDNSIHDEFISIIIPAYNEASAIEYSLKKISSILFGANIRHEIIVIDDGSIDHTFKVLQDLRSEISTLKAIRFSRNFGKEAALLAGLKASTGDAVITMDSDLQHPPETIIPLLNKWRNGYKIVRAVKESRKYDSVFVQWRAALFNYIFTKFGGINLKDSSDFILMDRIAKDIVVNRLPERKRFYRGLVHWIGYDQAVVHFKVAERWDKGQSKWSLSMLFNLATTALVSFSSMPLRIITGLGIIVLCIGLLIGIDALISWYLGNAISGFATTVGTILIIGSFIMISLGIIGEYLAKIYDEIKARPISIIQDTIGFETQFPHRSNHDGSVSFVNNSTS